MPSNTNPESTDRKQRAVCPLCVRVVTKESREAAEEVVTNHNESQHDGDDVADVVGPFREDLQEFMDHVKEEFGPEVYGEIGSHIVQTDAWDVLDR